MWRGPEAHLVPVQPLQVNQNPHQLGNGQGRMGVIELDSYLLGWGEAGRESVWAANQGHGHCPLPLQSPLQGLRMVLGLSRRLSWGGCGAGGRKLRLCAW